jgi:ankyrin repeat protein
MKQLPERSNLEHLKKQAKELLRLYRNQDPTAIARFRASLPEAAGKDDAGIVSLALRLHDAQSCIAREYNFPSWADLRSYVEARGTGMHGRSERVLGWLRLVYAGEISGTNSGARPAVAARILAEDPDLAAADPYLACAVGNEDVVEAAIRSDPSWVSRAGGPLRLPPLVAVTHSTLMQLPEFRDRLRRSAQLLVQGGADPNQSVGNRWPPDSLESPSTEHRLSTLYGAAGRNHDPELTRLLLQAGANPNDGESLYHSLENPACTRLLLEAGARIRGSNAFYRVFDLDSVPLLELMLEFGADPNEPPLNEPVSHFGSPLMWAIYRRRSRRHVELLLEAGADPFIKTAGGVSAYRLALQFGLTEVAELVRARGAADELSVHETFIAACASGSAAQAREILTAHPGLLGELTESQLRQLPDLAAAGATEAVKLMVQLGWPIATRGGDWQASALNLAVFNGDADLARFLLEHGASWRERHGFGDNLCGTLSWASRNKPHASGDWVSCAEALVVHGMPVELVDGALLVDGRAAEFSEDVTEFLLTRTGAQ